MLKTALPPTTLLLTAALLTQNGCSSWEGVDRPEGTRPPDIHSWQGWEYALTHRHPLAVLPECFRAEGQMHWLPTEGDSALLDQLIIIRDGNNLRLRAWKLGHVVLDITHNEDGTFWAGEISAPESNPFASETDWFSPDAWQPAGTNGDRLRLQHIEWHAILDWHTGTSLPTALETGPANFSFSWAQWPHMNAPAPYLLRCDLKTDEGRPGGTLSLRLSEWTLPERVAPSTFTPARNAIPLPDRGTSPSPTEPEAQPRTVTTQTETERHTP